MPLCSLAVLLSSSQPEGFKYDAFLSFHDECDGFVCDHILKPLKAEGYKVCYHHDDFQPGIGIYDNIHGNMDNSRVAILVLSKVLPSTGVSANMLQSHISFQD